MLILVINSGSSSIKYQLFDIKGGSFFSKKIKDPGHIAKGIVARIGQPDSYISYENSSKKTIKEKTLAPNHLIAMKVIFDKLVNPRDAVIDDINKIKAIGHRVVHGGERFTESVIINKSVLNTVEKFNKHAPLHNPPALLGIMACKKILPDVPQVAVFDTAFHQTIPPKAYHYAIPFRFYKMYGVRRYGFHGTSHRDVSRKCAQILKRPLESLKIITCHLGNGCSITAVRGGKAIDTSMGFTPLEGLVMGTRCGDIDPAIILFLMDKERLNTKEVDNLLNKKSGLLGVSGISNDMRDLRKAAKKGNRRARLAIDLFIYRIIKYIGAYTAVMNGVDAIVFTAGIGENEVRIRSEVIKGVREIIKRFKTKVLVIPTNEELMIAHDTYELASKIK